MSVHSDDTVETDRAKPRRVALLSDVHGNLPAFQAVMRDIESVGVDARWNLGDLVGYGAQPNECVQLASETCDLVLAGNHDLVVLEELDINEFSQHAALAAEWTKTVLADEARSFLSSLEPKDEDQPLGLYHASPRDPVWEYVLSALLASDCMDAMGPRVGAVGHSHVALHFSRGGDGRTDGEIAAAGTELDLSSGEWLVNPGGVGQPRDGDPRAAWMLLDLDRWKATWRRVQYPIEQAADAIRQAGLPEMLAERLYYGQ